MPVVRLMDQTLMQMGKHVRTCSWRVIKTARYIRFSDIYDYTPEPDNENVGRYINMYLQDGSTIIGSFYVSSGGITNN